MVFGLASPSDLACTKFSTPLNTKEIWILPKLEVKQFIATKTQFKNKDYFKRSL